MDHWHKMGQPSILINNFEHVFAHKFSINLLIIVLSQHDLF